MNGLLFTQDFLLKGIQTTPVWVALSEAAVDEFTAGLRRVYAPYKGDSVLNEATTESEIILKVLSLLDWSDLGQAGASSAWLRVWRCHQPTRPRHAIQPDS